MRRMTRALIAALYLCAAAQTVVGAGAGYGYYFGFGSTC